MKLLVAFAFLSFLTFILAELDDIPDDFATTTSSSRPTTAKLSPQLNSGAALLNKISKPSANKPPRKSTVNVEGYPSAKLLTEASMARHNLLELLENPKFKHPNVDDMPVKVAITLIPLKIQDLNEKIEVLDITVRLQLTWLDKRLAWDPNLFSNVTEMVVSGETLWAPDIAILNSVSDVYDVVRDRRFEMKVEYSGRVWWHPTGILKTYCKLFLRYFPFDKQTCWFIFESPNLDVRFMNLSMRLSSMAVDTRMYLKGETWQLLNVGGRQVVNQVGAKTFFSRVEFYLHIERAKIYHVLNVILPAVFLSAVQVMFFLVPVTHPQRVGSSTTTLLSVVVFQTVAISHLPNTSTDVPLLTIYIFMVVIVSALSVATSIIVAKFAVYADQKLALPRLLGQIPHPLHCFRWLCCCCCGDRTEIITIDLSSTEKCDEKMTKRVPVEMVLIDKQPHQNVTHRASCKTSVRTPLSPHNSAVHQPLQMTGSVKSALVVVENELNQGGGGGGGHALATRTLSSYSSQSGKTLLPSATNQSLTSHLVPGPSAGNSGGFSSGSPKNFTVSSFNIHHQPYLQAGLQRTASRNRQQFVFANNDLIRAKENVPIPNRYLFNNWNDVSRYIDISLMLVATSIALLSPIVLFIIVPNLAEDFDPQNL